MERPKKEDFKTKLESGSIIFNVNAYDKMLENYVDYLESHKTLTERSDKIDLLSQYTAFLQKHGYIDSDATSEEPYAIDEFLKENETAKS